MYSLRLSFTAARLLAVCHGDNSIITTQWLSAAMNSVFIKHYIPLMGGWVKNELFCMWILYSCYLCRVFALLIASNSFCMTRQSALLAASMSNSNSTLYLRRWFSSRIFMLCFCNLEYSLEPPFPPTKIVENRQVPHSFTQLIKQALKSCGYKLWTTTRIWSHTH